jgi:TolA-binding protein
VLTDQFNVMQKMFRLAQISCVPLLLVIGCASFPNEPQSAPQQRSAGKPRSVDAKAQQKQYDLGLQQYSREDYDEAKKSFEQVIELGPNTALGVKAKENLKKIDQVLKTLEEIKQK